MSYIPDDIVREAESQTGKIRDTKPVAGGCINNGAKIRTSSGEFFLKWNSKKKNPGMFEAESLGLRLLKEPDCIKIPEVIGVIHGTEHSGLILEFIETSRTTNLSGERMGHRLAALHRNSSATYGLESNNYMGSLEQFNGPSPDLISFFIHQRLEPQINLALRNGRLGSDIKTGVMSLYERLPDLLSEDQPALIHGDLWSGNYLVDHDENPVLIDPAVSYGHREMDIAMTTLFGGFPESFYDAYTESWPLESGYRERMEIYNLYPLLIHVNLFGGGYASQVQQIINKYVD